MSARIDLAARYAFGLQILHTTEDPPFRWTAARVETLRLIEIGDKWKQIRARRKAKVFCIAEADED